MLYDTYGRTRVHNNVGSCNNVIRLVLPFVIYHCSVDDEVFLIVCSSGQMTDLLYTEKDLVTSLKDYIKAEENKLERVKQ